MPVSHSHSQAVAAVDRKVFCNAPACAALSGPATEPADAASGLGYHEGRPMGRPAEDIRPYRGWTLWRDRLGLHFYNRSYCYSAEKGGRFSYLHVNSRFVMTQARWEWLVDHSFPGCPSPRGGEGPWSEARMDAEIARGAAHG